MGILFKDIYQKAVALFEDPKITVAYKTNVVQFEKLMYTYLQNAIGNFQNPFSISIKLASYNAPVGRMETYEADGFTRVFTMAEELREILENPQFSQNAVDYVFVENNTFVKGEVNLETGSVTFPDVLPEGQEYALEVYYGGEFTAQFDQFNRNTQAGDSAVLEQVESILARLLVISWAEEERDMVLDIRNIMQDSDFKLMSNDRILSSKNQWVDQLHTEVLRIQNRLAWSIRFTGSATNLGRG